MNNPLLSVPHSMLSGRACRMSTDVHGFFVLKSSGCVSVCQWSRWAFALYGVGPWWRHVVFCFWWMRCVALLAGGFKIRLSRGYLRSKILSANTLRGIMPCCSWHSCYRATPIWRSLRRRLQRRPWGKSWNRCLAYSLCLRAVMRFLRLYGAAPSFSCLSARSVQTMPTAATKARKPKK